MRHALRLGTEGLAFIVAYYSRFCKPGRPRGRPEGAEVCGRIKMEGVSGPAGNGMISLGIRREG